MKTSEKKFKCFKAFFFLFPCPTLADCVFRLCNVLSLSALAKILWFLANILFFLHLFHYWMITWTHIHTGRHPHRQFHTLTSTHEHSHVDPLSLSGLTRRGCSGGCYNFDHSLPSHSSVPWSAIRISNWFRTKPNVKSARTFAENQQKAEAKGTPEVKTNLSWGDDSKLTSELCFPFFLFFSRLFMPEKQIAM